MLSTQALREQIDRYAEGSMSAGALEEWLASESWDTRRWAPEGLQRLVESIQSAFIRHSDGDLSAEDLNAFLRERREQLHRAADASRAGRAAIDRLLQSVGRSAHVAVNEAVIVSETVQV